MKGNNLLLSAALLSFLIAALHVYVIFAGAPAYRYFGAGEEMAQLDEAGSWIPAVVTLGITAIFALFGLYALAGAGKFRKLPLLKITLFIISAIFLMRGLAVVAEIYVASTTPDFPQRNIYFSLVSLLTGLLFAAGTWQNRAHLNPARPHIAR